jgi:hypothetical protein
MLFDAAEVGSPASKTASLPKRQHGQFMLRSWFVENFFIIVPAMRSDRSRTSDVNLFRFRNFSAGQ